MFQITQKLMCLALSIPRIHINTCCTTIVIVPTVKPILSVPYLQFLVAGHSQLIGKIAKNELWRCVVNSIETVKVLFLVAITTARQAF